MLKYNNLPIDHYINKLLSNETYSISRWGNGEFDSVFNLRPPNFRNKSKHNYFPEIGIRLKEILELNPKYYLAIASRITDENKNDHKKYYELVNQFDLEWNNCDVFYQPSKNNNIELFTDAINKYPVVLVGPPHFEKLEILTSTKIHIKCPLINCWLSYDEILDQIIEYLDNQKETHFISISFSLSAGILVDDLYNRYGDKHYFADIGSLWDPYCNVISRNYHKTLDIIKNART